MPGGRPGFVLNVPVFIVLMTARDTAAANEALQEEIPGGLNTTKQLSRVRGRIVGQPRCQNVGGGRSHANSEVLLEPARAVGAAPCYKAR